MAEGKLKFILEEEEKKFAAFDKDVFVALALLLPEAALGEQ